MDDTTRWVSATKTRNWMEEDPLLDWLDLYGEENGFVRDSEDESTIPDADFGKFIVAKGIEFEARVLGLIRERLAGHGEVVQVADGPKDGLSEDCRDRTLFHMRQGVPAVAQAVLWHEVLEVYGVADLLVRSDLLGLLTTTEPAYPPARAGAPKLGLAGVHYVPLEIKFRTFEVNAKGEAGSCDKHRAQLAIYHAALAESQGYAPPVGFFLGRGWKKGSGAKQESVANCLDRLIPCSLPAQPQHRGGPTNWLERALEAVAWIRRVRMEGRNWSPLPVPSVRELRPNMKNTQDAPWHSAKRQIADALGEPTRIWHVSVDVRNRLVETGFPAWREPGFDVELAASKGKDIGERIRSMLDLNRDADGPIWLPSRVDWSRDEWAEPEALEFFVDFETTSNLDDDFSKLPEAGGQPLIFMIGCGHWVPKGEGAQPGWYLDPARREWKFKVFCTKDLSEAEERRIVFEWAKYMEEVRASTPGAPERPRVFHWSPAETRTYSMGSDSAFVRHLEPSEWPMPNWYDFLAQVVKPSGCSNAFHVRGAWGFGLKAIGKSLHKHGFIQTEWGEGPADGLAAMSGSWTCYRIAKEQGIPVESVVLLDRAERAHFLFQEVIAYNEVDCKVMAECIQFIRTL